MCLDGMPIANRMMQAQIIEQRRSKQMQYDHHVRTWEWVLFGSLRWLRIPGTDGLVGDKPIRLTDHPMSQS